MSNPGWTSQNFVKKTVPIKSNQNWNREFVSKAAALGQVQAAKAAQLQRQQEIRVGEAWPRSFQVFGPRIF